MRRKNLSAYMAFLMTFILTLLTSCVALAEEPKGSTQKPSIPFADMVLGWLFTILIWLKNWVWPFDNGEYAWLRFVCMLLSFGWMALSFKGMRTALNYIGGVVVAIIAFVFVAGILLSIPAMIWNLVGWPEWLKWVILIVALWLAGGLIWGLTKRWLGSFLTVLSWARTIPGRIKNAAHPVWMILGGITLAGLICHERTVMFTEGKPFAGFIPILSASIGGIVLLYRGYQTAFGKRATRGLREKFTRKPDQEGVSRCFKEQFFIDDATGAITMERCSGHLGKEEKVCKKCGWPNANFEACACGKLLQRDSYEKEVHCPDCSTAHPPRYHKSKHWRRIHGGLFRQEDIDRLTPSATPALPASQVPAGLLPAAQPGQPGAAPAAQPGPQIRTEEIELDDDGDIVKGAASCWVTEQGQCPDCGHAVAASHETCTRCGHALRRTAAARRADESLPRTLFEFLQETTP